MKKLLKYVLIFLLPVAVLAIPLDHFISRQLKVSSTYAYREYPVWNDIYKGNIQSDLLILGSSRAWRHIDPSIMHDSLGVRAYNLGMDGQRLPMQLWRYDLFSKKNKKPKIILYSLDFFMLGETNELFNKDQFLPYMLQNTEMEAYLKKYKGFDYYDYRVPLARYIGAQPALFHAARTCIKPTRPQEGRVNGFFAEDKTWNKDFEKVKAAMKSYNATVDTAVLHQFDAFLTQCNREQIKVVLVYSPEFFEGQQFVENRQQIIGSFQQLSKAHEVPFLDYSKDPICQEQSLFYNATHLNQSGARLFSKKLASDLKTILR